MELKDIIKSRRIALGLTQKEVADYVGVSEATLSRWESGEIKNLRRNRIAALAKILNVDVFSLVDFDTASEMISDLNITPKKEMLLDNPPAGLSKRALEVAFDYDNLDNRGKRTIDTYLESEKAALTDDRG